MIADEIGALPKLLARFRIEAGRTRRSEGDIDPALLDGRRGRGVAVELVAELRRGHAEEDIVAQDFAAVLIDADGAEFGAFLVGRGQPDLRAPDHGRRPGLAVDRGLPL